MEIEYYMDEDNNLYAVMSTGDVFSNLVNLSKNYLMELENYH